MGVNISFGKAEVVGSTDAEALAAPAPQPRPSRAAPFRIALIGAFRGRSPSDATDATSTRRLRSIAIDRDNFDAVMDRLGVSVTLPVAGADGPPIALSFRELDDFEPDRILARAEVFRALRETRRALLDPATFDAAAASLLGARTGPAPSPTDAAGLLNQMLGMEVTHPAEAPKSTPAGEWDEFLGRITAPHRVERADPRQAELVASVDAATSELLRAILHHPDFQRIEANWRGVHLLTRRLETGEGLSLALVDLSRDEIEADLIASDDPRRSGLFKLLVEETIGTPGAVPWSVLIGLETFDATPIDAALLGCLGQIAEFAGAPYLAAAGPRLIGCAALDETPDPDDWALPLDPDAQDAWDDLRSRREAHWLGLALPRFLLRLPYGRETRPIDAFDFEEFAERPRHADFLWGHPGFVLAYLLGAAFHRAGWDLRPGDVEELDDLPLYVDPNDVQAETLPCAEVLLTSRAADRILARGLMPLASIKHRDAIRLLQFRSLADPPAALQGRWA